MALSVSNSQQIEYTLYILMAAMTFAGAAMKWFARKIDSAENVAKDFMKTHDKLAESAQAFMLKTTEHMSGTHYRLESIDKTLDVHGERLESIDQRIHRLQPNDSH
jgi:hypothetical protein